FAVTKGLYGFHVMFTSKDGHKTSSFNGTSCVTRDLDRELITCGSVDRLLRESVEQTDPQGLSGRFVGDLILTPDVFADFLGLYLDTFLRDSALIAGTSRLKDKLDQQVSAPCITVHDLPRSAELASNHFLTPDGFLAQDHTIIDRGTLKTYLLSLYGARKTGLARALNVGTSCIVEAGDRGIDDIVDGVERGIILGRFSGGNPGESGDVSGVAKNSYYVEDGQVRYPVTETMISSNLLDLFANAGAVSSERVDFGSTILPWVRCTGVTISGK
ncbi:MAG: metallopeptidase TldD-related protein, partial [Candidatus Eisenbacteria bacterium]|nr:metallopeptidase TldD-related protein [Candidatus Eisenbacteria bacterium]